MHDQITYVHYTKNNVILAKPLTGPYRGTNVVLRFLPITSATDPIANMSINSESDTQAVSDVGHLEDLIKKLII